MGVGAVVSACVTDCGLREVFIGSNGNVGEIIAD